MKNLENRNHARLKSKNGVVERVWGWRVVGAGSIKNCTGGAEADRTMVGRKVGGRAWKLACILERKKKKKGVVYFGWKKEKSWCVFKLGILSNLINRKKKKLGREKIRWIVIDFFTLEKALN